MSVFLVFKWIYSTRT